jgi:hypothetical protein
MEATHGVWRKRLVGFLRRSRSLGPKGLKTVTVRNRQRSIASVNRELSLLRNMLNVAVQEGWIRNPFGGGRPLINAADEHKRERILCR